MVDDLTRLGQLLHTDFQATIEDMQHGWLDDAPLAGADWQQLLQLEIDSLQLWQLTAQMAALQRWLTAGFLPHISPGGPAPTGSESPPADHTGSVQAPFWQTPPGRLRPAAHAFSRPALHQDESITSGKAGEHSATPPSGASPEAAAPSERTSFPSAPQAGVTFRPRPPTAPVVSTSSTASSPPVHVRQPPAASQPAGRPPSPTGSSSPVQAQPSDRPPQEKRWFPAVKGPGEDVSQQSRVEDRESVSSDVQELDEAEQPAAATPPRAAEPDATSRVQGLAGLADFLTAQPYEEPDEPVRETDNFSNAPAKDREISHPQPGPTVTLPPDSIQEQTASSPFFWRSPEDRVVELFPPGPPAGGEKPQVSPTGRAEAQESVANLAPALPEERTKAPFSSGARGFKMTPVPDSSRDKYLSSGPTPPATLKSAPVAATGDQLIEPGTPPPPDATRSEERFSKNLSPQASEQSPVRGLADLAQALESASPDVEAPQSVSRPDDETPQSMRHRRRVDHAAAALPELASPELLQLAEAAGSDNKESLSPQNALLPPSARTAQPAGDKERLAQPGQPEAPRPEPDPNSNPDAAAPEERALLQPATEGISSPAGPYLGANGQSLPQETYPSSGSPDSRLAGGDFEGQESEPAGSPTGSIVREHAAKVSHLSGFEPHPDLSHAELDLILEALAAEIKREYKRFYGD